MCPRSRASIASTLMVLSALKCRSRSIGKPSLPRTDRSSRAREADVTELGLADAEIAEPEGEPAVGVDLGEEPGGCAVRGEGLDDGLEVNSALFLVHGLAPCVAVGEELFGLCVMSVIERFLVKADPIWSGHKNPRTKWVCVEPSETRHEAEARWKAAPCRRGGKRRMRFPQPP